MNILNKNDDLKYDFTIVLYNIENCIEDSIKSIINQKYDFKKVEMLFINDGTDENHKIALNYKKLYPENFFIIENDEKDMAKSLNLGLKYSKGKYINFLNSGDLLSDNALSEIASFFSKVTSLDAVIIHVDEGGEKFLINYDFIDSNQIIDIAQYPEVINSVLSSFFIKKESINVNFNLNIDEKCDLLFIDELLVNSKIGIARNPKVEKLSSNSLIKSKISLNQFKHYYDFISTFCNEQLGYLPNYIQYKIAMELASIAEIEDIDDILSVNITANDVYNYLNEILNHINVSNIKGNIFINQHTQNFLLYLKNNDFHINIDENEVIFYCGNQVLNVLTRQNIWLDIIEIKEDYINFSGSITSYCEYEHITIEAIKEVNGETEIIPVKFIDYSTTERKIKKFLSFPWVYSYNFDAHIPISDCKNCKISFRYTYSEKETRIDVMPNIKFRKYASLSAFSHYFIKDSRIVLFTSNSFLVMPYSLRKVFKFELSSIRKILQSTAKNKIKTIGYKAIYLSLLPYMVNKKIWLMGG